MSYILDALKKLEHEKHKQSQGGGGLLSLSGDLLRDSERGSQKKGGIGKLVAIVVAASLATSGVTWFLLRGNSTNAPVAKALPAPAPVVQPMPSAVTQAAPATPQIPQASAPASPKREAAEPVKKADLVASPLASGAASAAPVAGKTKRAKNALPAAPISQEAGTQQLSAAPGDIKVSGIAWQEDRAARRAVVNGFLLKEGGNVAGAKITEITQDRVRFNQSGKTFEVLMLASGVPASPR